MELTPEQRAIVEADDGPVVVIAGAGTGKTRVIVERVRWLLETKGDPGGNLAAEPTPRHGDPFGGPLVPEQILVLTYNVKATKELGDRLDEAVGAAVRARITVSNFHSFCQHVLTESAGDAGLPARPDVLDGVGQLLLLRDLRHTLDLRYHSDWSFPGFVQFINRAKDELVDPDDFDRFVETERQAYERRYGSYTGAPERLETQGNLAPLRSVRGAYAGLRANERAEAAGEERHYKPRMAEKVANREARRTVGGDGHAHSLHQFGREDQARIDALAAEYERDGAALEVMRLEELARVYRAYEQELGSRGALDFGEQIALVARLFKTRPNVLRRWQRQFRYLLVDEFQDANVAQIELIELLGRTPDRPDNVMVVGDDDQSIYRFRGASFAAFAEFMTRFSAPPAHAPGSPRPEPPRRLRIDRNFRSTAGSSRPPTGSSSATSPGSSPTSGCGPTARRGSRSSSTCVPGSRTRPWPSSMRSGPTRARSPTPAAAGPTSPSCIASTSTATPSWSGSARRTSRTPWSGACRCSRRPRSGTWSRACGPSRTPTTTLPSSG